MGETANLCGLLLCMVSAAGLIAQAVYVVRICSWVALLITIQTTLLDAPALRIGMHWRSVTLYTFNLVLSILCIVDASMYQSGFLTRGFCIGYGVVFLLVCLLTGAVYYILPLPTRFSIRGPFKSIGTMTFNVPSKTVAGSSDVTHPITIQCWFPINPASTYQMQALLWTSGHPDLQLRESLKLMKVLATNNKLPAFAVKHLSLARTNSNWQHIFDNLVTVSDSGEQKHKFPIAVYSHGLYGWRQIHHSACENLASEGFIVFACDHTPDSMCSRPLGEIPTVFGFPTPPGLAPDVERKFFQGGLERRIQQLTTLLTHIQSEEFLQLQPNLVGRLDYDNINLWGHSYGGGTISALCCRELPFKINSAVMLDGWIYPVPDADRKKGFQDASLLNISAERWPFGKYQVPFRADLVSNTKDNTQSNPHPPHLLDLVLRGSDHQNFVDIHLIARKFLLTRPSMLGPDLDCVQAIQAIDTILPAFFRGVAQSKKRGVNVEDVSVKVAADSDATAAAEPVGHLSKDITELIEVCNLGVNGSVHVDSQTLPAEVVRFIRQNVVPASEMPAEFGEDKVFKRIQQELEKAEGQPAASI